MALTQASGTRCRCGSALYWSAKVCDPCKAAAEASYRARRAAGAIPPSLRAKVLARDGMVCQHCARAVRRRRSRHDIERDTIEIDHVIPLNLGGETTVANLVVSCMGCNRKRGGRGGD